jgi:hypothetical protein
MGPRTEQSEADPAWVLDLEPSAPAEQWERVHQAVAQCAKLDLTVWYAFGSAKLTIRPEGKQCRMNLFFEGELTESESPEGYTCSGDPAIFKELDLVQDGEVLREMPPRNLPEALKPYCKALMPN